MRKRLKHELIVHALAICAGKAAEDVVDVYEGTDALVAHLVIAAALAATIFAARARACNLRPNAQ